MNFDARLTPAQAALVLQVSRQLVNYWRTTGKIVPDDTGRYRYGDLLTAERDTRRSTKSSRNPWRGPAAGCA